MSEIYFQDIVLRFSLTKPEDFGGLYRVSDSGFLPNDSDTALDITTFLDLVQKRHKDEIVHIWGKEISDILNIFASGLINIVAAGGLVQNPQGDILFIKRKGKWDLPKGKPEVGEELTQTAIREVSEECGINNLSILSPLPSTYHIYRLQNGGYVLKKSCWYHMLTNHHQTLVPQIEEEITEVLWVKRPVADTIKNGAYLSIKELISHFESYY